MNFFDKPNPFTERAKSPLYGSYIVSWIVWNWKIFLSLGYFDKEDYNGLNVVEYISATYLNKCENWLIPLGITILYVFALPFPDYWTLIFTEKRRRKKIDKKIEEGRRHSVPGNQYYDLQLEFEEEKSKILKVEGTMKKYKSESLKKKRELKEEQIKHQSTIKSYNESQEATRELNRKHNNLVNRHHCPLLNGRWTLEITDKKDTRKEIPNKDIKIKEYEGFLIAGNDETKFFSLEFIDFDQDNGKLNFVKYDLMVRKYVMCRLDIISQDRLEGSEGELDITYKRNKFEPNKIGNSGSNAEIY